MQQRESAGSLCWAVFVALTVSGLPVSLASAFCGFYVGGAGADLYNSATNVVMMREGTTTALSMQNNYEGPPESFALIIPVPQVLQAENVITLSPSLFDKVDQMAAPRLVEYWEQDPCYQPPDDIDYEDGVVEMAAPETEEEDEVVVEAEFEVGEYQVVVLSATQSTALDTWIRQNNYNIPEGAEPHLRPYVEGGSYFFVARVDAEKVRFSDDGRTMLSPLRFHYQSDTFSLPIRLGLINANGPQDLIVHILAEEQRYEVANYNNVTIPTNISVNPEVRESFGEFYAALFDRTIARRPRSVVTEYAWNASTCDPCPGPRLTGDDFNQLGADVMPSASLREVTHWSINVDDVQVLHPRGVDARNVQASTSTFESAAQACYTRHEGVRDPHRALRDVVWTYEMRNSGERSAEVVNVRLPFDASAEFVDCLKDRTRFFVPPRAHENATWTLSFTLDLLPRLRASRRPNLVLTRLHARYAPDDVGEDLVFREAGPIAGGRERMGDGGVEQGAQQSTINNFQGRYIIRHTWDGELACENPVRGRWGGPYHFEEGAHAVGPGEDTGTRAARELAFAPRGQLDLAAAVGQSIPDLTIEPTVEHSSLRRTGVARGMSSAELRNGAEPPSKKRRMFGCSAGARPGGLLHATVLVLGLALFNLRRRG